MAALTDDLPAFCAKIVEELAKGRHEVASVGPPLESETPYARSR
jgi:hypothetical protein